MPQDYEDDEQEAPEEEAAAEDTADEEGGDEDGAVPVVASMPQASPSVAPGSPTSQLLRQYFAQRLAGNSGGKVPYLQQLQDAQDMAQKNRFIAGMSQASANLGNSIARGAPLSQEPFQQMEKNAEQPVSDLEKQGNYMGGQDKALMAYFARQQATDSANQRAKDRNDTVMNAAGLKANAATAGAKQKQDTQTNKDFIALGDALDPNKARTGEFGKQQAQVNAADRASTLAQQYKSAGYNIPPAQMGEFSQSVANLVSYGGQAAESTVKRYVPNTMSGNQASIAQWISGDPKGAQQQAFVKQMLETVQREGDLARGKIKQIQLSRIPQYEHVAAKDQNRFSSVLQSHGVQPEEYSSYKKNGYKVAQPKQPAKGQYKAGDQVTVKGQVYTVGPDGDSLVPVQQAQR